MPLPLNDPFIETITERVRGVVSRQLGRSLVAAAHALELPEKEFRRLIDEPDRLVDVGFLIDVLAAMVRVLALDPQWLLTGEYDAHTHRRAVELVEAKGRAAEPTVRELLREKYDRARAGLERGR